MTAMANDVLDCGCVPGRLAVLGPDLARSQRDEEEIREGGDGERLNERSSASCCVVCLTHRTLLLLRFVCAFAPPPRAFVFQPLCVSTYSVQYCPHPRSSSPLDGLPYPYAWLLSALP